MEIEQSFALPFPADAVWRCFHDTAGIVACLPGASLGAAPHEGLLPITLTVKLGPIVASFAGEARLSLDEVERAGSVSGGGTDRKSGSRVKGTARFRVLETQAPAATTRVEVRVDYSIAGSLAQFSRGGIVQELAERLTVAFRDNLKARLEADQHAAAAPPASADSAPARSKAGVGAALDLGSLFWPLLLRRLRRLLGLAARN